MISVITSTLKPGVSEKDPRSFFDDEERYQQTVNTILALQSKGIDKIILADNSESFDFSSLTSLFPNLLIKHFNQFQFANKGINELLILLGTIKEIPADTPIFKISGRYFPDDNFIALIDENYDFKVKAYAYHTKRGSISTRGYFVKDKDVFEKYLLQCLNELFIYSNRVVGLQSFLNFARQLIKPVIPFYPSTSIEFASARVLKSGDYKVEFSDPIGITGYLAGYATKDLIIE